MFLSRLQRVFLTLKQFKEFTNNSKMIEQLCFARVNEHAKAPVYSSSHAAGMDLHACEDGTIPARGKGVVNLGIKIAIPTGHYGRIAPRSGLAVKYFIDVGAGVIDEDYRGELVVLLFNHSDSDYEVKRGDRIAQLIVEKISRPTLNEMEENELTKTTRGVNGFGSTGV